MPTVESCQREIEQLHAFFVRWYCGTTDSFDRVEAALGPSFERVSPDGTIHDRETVLDGVRGNHDEFANFEIAIRNVEPVFTTPEHTLVRYEEFQTTPNGENGRLSTALFGPAAGEPAAEWQHLQETWLDQP